MKCPIPDCLYRIGHCTSIIRLDNVGSAVEEVKEVVPEGKLSLLANSGFRQVCADCIFRKRRKGRKPKGITVYRVYRVIFVVLSVWTHIHRAHLDDTVDAFGHVTFVLGFMTSTSGGPPKRSKFASHKRLGELELKSYPFDGRTWNTVYILSPPCQEKTGTFPEGMV